MIKSMNVSELKSKIDNNENIVLVDCREQDEWNSGYIKSAILIALSEFAPKHGEILTDKSKTVVVQCRSGRRSLTACQLLLAEGFEDIYNLDGGILEWTSNGFAIEQD